MIYGLAFALFLAWSGAIGVIAYAKGSASRNSEIAGYQASIEVSRILAYEADQRAKQTAVRVVVEYRDRIIRIKERGPVETKLVEVVRVETPAGCYLPGAYRRLWDGSADSATVENPAGVDAAPVELAEAAAIAAEAKRRFEENAARLIALQTIIKEQVGNDHGKD